MFNQYVNQQVNTFERRQREQQAELQRIAKSIDVDHPTIWAQLHGILQGRRAQIVAPVGLCEMPIANEHR